MVHLPLDSNTNYTRKKVVIVGAGISGLICAAELLDSNEFSASDIIILEARDRIGGRIHTKFMNVGDGDTMIPFDLGAAWVHGTLDNPMLESPQLQGSDLALIDRSPHGNPWTRPRLSLFSEDSPLIDIYCNGKKVPLCDVLRGLDLYENIMNAVAKVGYAAYYCGEGLSLSKLSVSDAIQSIQSCLSQTAMFSSYSKYSANIFLHMFELWHGCDLDDIQLSEIAADEGEQEAGCDGDFPGPHCGIRGGMCSLLKPLESKVGKLVQLESEVTKIICRDEDDERSLDIICKNGNCIQSNFCVVTVPLGCLCSHVNTMFEPALSQNKVEAINTVEMGSYTKIIMCFDEIWWPSSMAHFVGLVNNRTDRSKFPRDLVIGEYVALHNFWAGDGVPVIEIIVIGDASKRIGIMDEAHLRDEIFYLLEGTIANGAIDKSQIESKCRCFYCTKWDNDPYSKGAYSHWPLNASHEHIEEIASPEWGGRLLFAGEATVSEYEGSVHAAIFSGKSVAKEIIKMLRDLE